PSYEQGRGRLRRLPRSAVALPRPTRRSTDAHPRRSAYAGDAEVMVMKAAVGDQLHMHSNQFDMTDRIGEIVEVRGPDVEPPYLFRFADVHERLVFPRSDSVVISPK